MSNRKSDFSVLSLPALGFQMDCIIFFKWWFLKREVSLLCMIYDFMNMWMSMMGVSSSWQKITFTMLVFKVSSQRNYLGPASACLYSAIIFTPFSHTSLNLEELLMELVSPSASFHGQSRACLQLAGDFKNFTQGKGKMWFAEMTIYKQAWITQVGAVLQGQLPTEASLLKLA